MPNASPQGKWAPAGVNFSKVCNFGKEFYAGLPGQLGKEGNTIEIDA